LEERIVRLARSVIAATVVVAAAAIGITAAQASPGPAQRDVARIPGAEAVTAPAELVPNPNPNTKARARAQATVGAAANAASFNWSGYVANDGGYTSVTSNWIQPAVTCSSNGIVSFWVGLDGWTNGTVEQTGTGADCRTGKPQYYAWWQTFPANSQQTYVVTVAPGDSLSSTVSFADGQYTLVLTDSTQAWTKTTVAAAPAGSANASAEIVAEAASVNKAVTLLPEFATATFTGSEIDGTALPTTAAAPVDMVNQSGSVIASTGAEDDTGAFDVTYRGGVAGVQAAFQSSAGTLHTYDAAGDVNQKQTMLPGTSPSIAGLPAGGYETAYQNTDGDLVVSGTGTSGPLDTGLGVAPGTSPSITALPKGGFEVAFQANTGLLWTYTSAGTSANLDLGLMRGTSPSIAALASGAVAVVFQANTGQLWTYTSATGTAASAKLGMAPGTSPSVAALAKGGFIVAFQSDTGFLWMYSSNGSSVNQGLGMAAGTSPAIATASGGGYGVAIEANTRSLWTFVSGVGSVDQKLALAPGAGPSIVAVPGGYESAVQAASGDFVVTGPAGRVDTGQVMLKGTSPDIAP
jgi:hypothetical protein